VAEAVEELADELPRSGSITFRRLTTGLVDRIEVVVRFLAVLELFKQGLIDLDQAANFGEIQIRWLHETEDHQFELAAYVERFVRDGQSSRLSAAALETVAIIAYKQPISRAQVASIRGVNVDGVIRTLTQRGYVVEVGRDPGPGQAVLFGTTPEFLERLGLDSLEDLPPLAEYVPGSDVVEALEGGLRAEPLDTVTDATDETIDLTGEDEERPAPA